MAPDGLIVSKMLLFCTPKGCKNHKAQITAYLFHYIAKTSRFSLSENVNYTRNQKEALVISTGHALYQESIRIPLHYSLFQTACLASGFKKTT